jgi:3-oxoacyl-[acyl-carrier protein] reductase
MTGKTALVTGASRGMGRTSALKLAEAGAQVVVHFSSGAEEAERVVGEIRKGGGRADALGVDLSAADGPHKLAKRAHEIIGDRLDILVANAGVSKAAKIEDTTVEDFDRLFAINMRAPFFLVQQLLPILGKGASVVFLSSLAAHAVVGLLPAYGATKGAIETMTRHFASLLGERGIRVNAVAPGVVETDMSNFTKIESGRAYALGMQTLKRLAQPDDISGVVAFLASEEARLDYRRSHPRRRRVETLRPARTRAVSVARETPPQRANPPPIFNQIIRRVRPPLHTGGAFLSRALSGRAALRPQAPHIDSATLPTRPARMSAPLSRWLAPSSARKMRPNPISPASITVISRAAFIPSIPGLMGRRRRPSFRAVSRCSRGLETSRSFSLAAIVRGGHCHRGKTRTKQE